MKTKFIVILISTFLCINLQAQNDKKIDSLLGALRRSIPDTMRIKILNTLSGKLLTIGAFEKVKQYADTALAISQKINDKYGIAHSYVNIGNYYFEAKDNYQEAFKNYTSALNIGIDIGNKKIMSASYTGIGNIFNSQGNNPEALKNYLKSLKLDLETGQKKGAGICYDNIGLIYRVMGNYQEALKNHLAALSIFKVIGNKTYVANCDKNIGMVYGSLHDNIKADKNLFEALKIYQETDDKNGIAQTLDEIATSQTEQGNLTKALKYYESALKMDEEIDAKNNMAIVCNNMGHIYISMKKPALAQKYLGRGLHLAKEMGATDITADLYHGLSRVDSAKGDFKSAYENHKLYKKLYDSLFNANSHDKITQMTMQYDFDKKEAAAKAEQDKKDLKQASILVATRQNRNYIVGLLSVILIFSAVIYYYSIRQKKVAFQRKVSQTELKALRAQMNPHFIFNALNSIYNYMHLHDYKSASHYLVNFTRLMRLTLENSLQPEISLEDELQALELYMTLESERMDHKFSFYIEVDEAVDRSNTFVPPLIFQPFVENSIWHGLQEKEGEGKIDIVINKRDNLLNCTVIDNGTGRKQTVISKARTKGKKSVGLSLTQERISILNKRKKAKGYLNFTDLFDEFNKPAGLRVEIAIPLEQVA